VVSDDIPVTKHAPVLFGLTTAGELDPEPFVVHGLSELNDLESICAGPNDTFFVTTSHSHTKKGISPASRRHLLHLALDGHGLRVLGDVDLRETLKSDLFDVEDALDSVDLEGLAWRGSDLYLGFKGPLGRDGRATILRVNLPENTLTSGKIPASALSVWARPKLCVTRDGHEVCQGIADLTFVNDGELLLVANAPKGGASDGGGALWRLPGPDAEPTLNHWFQGYKPEGIALAPDGVSVTIVFDRDRKQPRWVTWPL
jgi:hypothetical protein